MIGNRNINYRTLELQCLMGYFFVVDSKMRLNFLVIVSFLYIKPRFQLHEATKCSFPKIGKKLKRYNFL